MKHILLCVFLIIAAGNVFSQIESFYLGENIKEIAREKKIKEIKGEMFKYAHGVIEKNSKTVFFFRFDEKGNTIKKMLFSFKKDKATANYDYTYGANDVLTGENEYDGAGHLALKCKYIYDDKGRLTEREKTKPNGNISSNILYRYDESNNLISEEWYNSKGSIYEEKKYEYNENGNLISEKHFNNDGNIVTHFVYKYDDKNRLSELINHYADGNIYDRWVYEYDLSGNRKREYHYFSGEQPECYLDYIYDEYFIIKEVNLYVESGKISKTFKYIYTYY